MFPPRRNPPLGPPKRSSRARALADLRRVDYEPLEKAKADTAQPVAKLIGGVVQSLGLDRKRGEAEIVKVWNDLIDPTLTAHAQPTRVWKGTLFVNVDNSVWLDEIVRYRRREILSRMQNAFGKEMIQRISFRAG
ncbi:MAG: DUF721 domain-containing protein [Verrucomicrobia bacterium]|nr:DUF721 domain-containing protein [Verrucomicrobiota bacterium]